MATPSNGNTMKPKHDFEKKITKQSSKLKKAAAAERGRNKTKIRKEAKKQNQSSPA